MSNLGSRADFEADGYWVGPALFSEEQVTEARRHFDDVLAGRYDLGQAPQGVNRFGDAMVKVSNAWRVDSMIRDIVMHPHISMIASVLLDADELYLWADSLYWKKPNATGEQAMIGWHQDKQYWAASSSDKMITACVALYDADVTTGGMRFIRGSNRWGLVGGSEALTADENRGTHGLPRAPLGLPCVEVCPRLRAGQVTFHHALTFHGSGLNLSPEPRRSITIHMVSGEARLTTAELSNPDFAGMLVGDAFRPPLFPRLWPL
jgi:ectoine hydroxylase-related dioxygenase (phytanoyl-CoA dioxygenase family)